jgi:uncharacterized OsmC-like protein
MSEDSFRTVSVERATVGRYVARNVRGGTLDVGTGEDNSFTPVELLLVAIGACTAIDVDLVVSRRAEPDTFLVNISGDKIRDEGGNRMEHLAVEFRVAFPEGPEGDAARAAPVHDIAQVDAVAAHLGRWRGPERVEYGDAQHDEGAIDQ